MRFIYAEAMTDPTFYLPLAQAADAAGYDGMNVSDSIIYPRDSHADYPYTADGTREFLENKDFPESFILITAMGAVTSRIEFTPAVLKLPVRPPVLVAKQAATIAFLTGDRLRLGVGSSPWPEDYAAMGVPWEGRGKRVSEAIDIIRGLTAGGYFSHHGEVYDLPAVKIRPVPTRPIPILVGGHSDAALRRAVRKGDGWIHAGGTREELDGLLGKLQTMLAAEDRGGRPFAIQVTSPEAFTPDGVRRLQDRGVNEVRVTFRNPYIQGEDPEPLAKKIENLERYAADVIAKVNA
ncbi:LLM class F420-dependent oxidoreductase [Actinomadura sp. CNU-125]|uniref:TIGR03619 family F420-dependent LLM class oxidoreductase n=1 Tax=Actinomadura sp. CNU-125 TaxID=1904961 RepID=UPI0009608E6A|nr:TIGR03619 family F420-dependent LLM class oxidoreductase [Actinomadura sp. CNU-125]OLT33921.1 LLM class F420-dependent oxidoreductase [Actinomadura sp. CNU-125]